MEQKDDVAWVLMARRVRQACVLAAECGALCADHLDHLDHTSHTNHTNHTNQPPSHTSQPSVGRTCTEKPRMHWRPAFRSSTPHGLAGWKG